MVDVPLRSRQFRAMWGHALKLPFPVEQSVDERYQCPLEFDPVPAQMTGIRFFFSCCRLAGNYQALEAGWCRQSPVIPWHPRAHSIRRCRLWLPRRCVHSVRQPQTQISSLREYHGQRSSVMLNVSGCTWSGTCLHCFCDCYLFIGKERYGGTEFGGSDLIEKKKLEIVCIRCATCTY